LDDKRLAELPKDYATRSFTDFLIESIRDTGQEAGISITLQTIREKRATLPKSSWKY
jgi:hypothetical protein